MSSVAPDSEQTPPLCHKLNIYVLSTVSITYLWYIYIFIKDVATLILTDACACEMSMGVARENSVLQRIFHLSDCSHNSRSFNFDQRMTCFLNENKNHHEKKLDYVT